MSTDLNPVFLGQHHSLSHYMGITPVESTGHVGRGNESKNLLIPAEAIYAKAFSQVAVEVHGRLFHR